MKCLKLVQLITQSNIPSPLCQDDYHAIASSVKRFIETSHRRQQIDRNRQKLIERFLICLNAMNPNEETIHFDETNGLKKNGIISRE